MALPIKAFVPTLPRLTQEIIVQLIAVLAAAWIISKTPAFKAIMQSANSLSVLDNPPQ